MEHTYCKPGCMHPVNCSSVFLWFSLPILVKGWRTYYFEMLVLFLNMRQQYVLVQLCDFGSVFGEHWDLLQNYKWLLLVQLIEPLRICFIISSDGLASPSGILTTLCNKVILISSSDDGSVNFFLSIFGCFSNMGQSHGNWRLQKILRNQLMFFSAFTRTTGASHMSLHFLNGTSYPQ